MTSLEAFSFSGRLVGTLPMESGVMESLTELQLQNNKISGGLPSELLLLSDLQKLDLSWNLLAGAFQGSDFFCLTSLEWLALGYDLLCGSLSSRIGLMQSLICLELHANAMPSEIGQLTLLESLGMNENDRGGTIPTEIGNLRSLLVFGMRSTMLTGTIPTHIGLLTDTITSLDLSSNMLIGTVQLNLA